MDVKALALQFEVATLDVSPFSLLRDSLACCTGAPPRSRSTAAAATSPHRATIHRRSIRGGSELVSSFAAELREHVEQRVHQLSGPDRPLSVLPERTSVPADLAILPDLRQTRLRRRLGQFRQVRLRWALDWRHRRRSGRRCSRRRRCPRRALLLLVEAEGTRSEQETLLSTPRKTAKQSRRREAQIRRRCSRLEGRGRNGRDGPRDQKDFGPSQLGHSGRQQLAHQPPEYEPRQRETRRRRTRLRQDFRGKSLFLLRLPLNRNHIADRQSLLSLVTIN